jgi:tRNA(fMet)-specific endonuclease VapC
MQMIGNKCVLDTSIVIEAFKRNNAVADLLDAMEEVYVPVTVIGELTYGAYKAADTPKHLNQVNAFLDNCSILPIDATTAEVYAKTKTAFSKKGNPIPENDIWIAAVAVQYDLPLFAKDHHFEAVDNLEMIHQAPRQ